MRYGCTILALALTAAAGGASAQSASFTAPSRTTAATGPAATTATPATSGPVAPRTPGGTSAGAVQGDQGRMNATVGGINNRLLNQEKDRPNLPGQAPSPSQTLPGGTASGQTPH